MQNDMHQVHVATSEYQPTTCLRIREGSVPLRSPVIPGLTEVVQGTCLDSRAIISLLLFTMLQPMYAFLCNMLFASVSF